MLVDLRSGGRGRPLFVFPGLGGHARELSALSSKIGGQRPIIAVEAFATSTDGFAPTTVESMAALAVQYIKARQSEGPYRLLGYSFGGLVALEVASRLRSAGESVVYLGLIDTYYDHRYWPTRTFVAAQFRRAWFHLSAIAKKSLPQAISEIGVRAGRLVGRLGQRAATQASDHPSEKPQDRQEVCALAMAKYQPKMVSGKVTLYRSKGGADFGCDPAKILSPYILDLDIRSIDSDHMRLVRDDRALDDLSRSLTRDIAASGSAARTRACRVLMVTSFNWFNATRLGHALHVAGFDVQVLCPPRHTLAQVGFIDRVYPYRPLALRACLLAAIEAADPYLVIPCDDHMAASLHQLFDELVSTDQASSRLRALISRSLGAPENLSLLHRRAVIMDVAAQRVLGIRRPSRSLACPI